MIRRLGLAMIIAGILSFVVIGYIAVDPQAKSKQNSAVVAAEEKLKLPADGNPRVAIMKIPSLGSDWKKIITEGTGDESLALGIGHYSGTPYAGQDGNAGYAGHRSGNGNPLLDIEKVQIGDSIIVTDSNGDHIYLVKEIKIVMPNETWVLDQRKGKWLTLTTCWPKWGNEKRYVLFAHMA